MEQITLDLIPTGSLPVLHASQYDDGRQWKVNLKENGEDYTLTNETIVLDVRKGDGCAVTCAVAVESGKKYVILTSTEQMCAVAGQNLAELQITKGNMKIGTLNFILQVERDPLNGSISSSSEIHDLQHQVDECVDNALADLGASGLPYDNTESGLEATNVQQAIDEVNEKASELDSELDDKADKSNTYTKSEVNDIADTKADADNVYAKSETYTKTEVDTLINSLPEPMIFKGTLGVNGTITELPTASTSNEGYTYKVITEGTYAGTPAKVGDVFVSAKPEGSSAYSWVLIPSGDEDNDTWRAIKVNGVEKLGNAISSGSVDFVDTTNVKFEFDSNGNAVKATLNGIDTSSEVDAKVAGLIDDTSTVNDKAWSSEKTNAELVALLPVDEVSGAIANFDTDVVLPLIDVKAEIKAVETGTGAKSPSNPYVISGFTGATLYQRGGNLFDEVMELGVLDNNGNIRSSTSNLVSTNKFAVKGGATLYFSCVKKISTNQRFGVAFYDKDQNFINGSGEVIQTSTFATPQNACFMRFFVPLSWYVSSTYENDISINYPTTDTAYHTYNPNGTVYPVSWQTEAGEVFGGYFDLTTGKLVVTHKAKVKLRDVGGNWNYSSTANRFYGNVSDCLSKTSVALHIGLCECYVEGNVGNNNQGDNEAFMFYQNTLFIRDNNYTDATTWLSAVGDYYITYQLATPVEYDLTPQQISALLGVNNIWNDTNGDTTVKYKLGIQKYIDKKIAEVQALVL